MRKKSFFSKKQEFRPLGGRGSLYDEISACERSLEEYHRSCPFRIYRDNLGKYDPDEYTNCNLTIHNRILEEKGYIFIRCVFVGDNCYESGKTSLICKMIEGVYPEEPYKITDNKREIYRYVGGKKIKFGLFDEFEEYHEAHSLQQHDLAYYDAVIMCFDLTDKSSLENLCNHINLFTLDKHTRTNIIIVGTNAENPSLSAYDTYEIVDILNKLEGSRYPPEYQFSYVEISAKTDLHVETLLTLIAEQKLYDLTKKEEIRDHLERLSHQQPEVDPTNKCVIL